MGRGPRDFLARGFASAEIEDQLARCKDVAARLVRSPWGRWHIKRIASARLACGTLDGERVDVVVGRSRRGYRAQGVAATLKPPAAWRCSRRSVGSAACY